MEFLQVADVIKTFGKGFTLGELSFRVFSGELLGFLGKNGAGKSTLFQILSANLNADKGQVLLEGYKLTPDNPECRKFVGYLPQHLALPAWVTPREVLRYAGSLYELEQVESSVEQAMHIWDCVEYANRPLSACSHGMHKRVGLALATLRDPNFLILDEPFSGLDLVHTRTLQQYLQRRQQAGQVTLISTHIAPYVAELCTAVNILENGQHTVLEGWSQMDYKARLAAIDRVFL